MTEEFLHHAWKFRLFNQTNLKTENGEALEIFITVVLTNGERIIGTRQQTLHGGGHAFLRSFADVNLHDGHGVFVERKVLRERIGIVFDDGFVAQR